MCIVNFILHAVFTFYLDVGSKVGLHLRLVSFHCLRDHVVGGLGVFHDNSCSCCRKLVVDAR